MISTEVKIILDTLNSLFPLAIYLLTAAGLAQSVERLIAELEVVGWIIWTEPILRKEGTSFALQTARPSHSWDDHVKWWLRLQKETQNMLFSISTFVLNTLTLKLSFLLHHDFHASITGTGK